MIFIILILRLIQQLFDTSVIEEISTENLLVEAVLTVTRPMCSSMSTRGDDQRQDLLAEPFAVCQGSAFHASRNVCLSRIDLSLVRCGHAGVILFCWDPHTLTQAVLALPPTEIATSCQLDSNLMRCGDDGVALHCREPDDQSILPLHQTGTIFPTLSGIGLSNFNMVHKGVSGTQIESATNKTIKLTTAEIFNWIVSYISTSNFSTIYVSEIVNSDSSIPFRLLVKIPLNMSPHTVATHSWHSIQIYAQTKACAVQSHLEINSNQSNAPPDSFASNGPSGNSSQSKEKNSNASASGHPSDTFATVETHDRDKAYRPSEGINVEPRISKRHVTRTQRYISQFVKCCCCRPRARHTDTVFMLQEESSTVCAADRCTPGTSTIDDCTSKDCAAPTGMSASGSTQEGPVFKKMSPTKKPMKNIALDVELDASDDDMDIVPMDIIMPTKDAYPSNKEDRDGREQKKIKKPSRFKRIRKTALFCVRRPPPKDN